MCAKMTSKKNAPKFGRTFLGSETSFTPRVCDQKWHFCAQNRGALPYIYIYTYTVKFLTWPSLGFLNVTNWAKLKGTNWAKVIFAL